MRFIVLAIAFSSMASTGCAPTKLSRAGQAVETNPTADVTRCRHLGSITGSSGGNVYASTASHITSATNALRNEAAKLGATHVIPGMASTNSTNGNTSSVSMVGNAYDCRVMTQAPPRAVTKPKGPATGTERGKCYGNNTCNAGLTCASDLCVKLP